MLIRYNFSEHSDLWSIHPIVELSPLKNLTHVQMNFWIIDLQANYTENRECITSCIHVDWKYLCLYFYSWIVLPSRYKSQEPWQIISWPRHSISVHVKYRHTDMHSYILSWFSRKASVTAVIIKTENLKKLSGNWKTNRVDVCLRPCWLHYVL